MQKFFSYCSPSLLPFFIVGILSPFTPTLDLWFSRFFYDQEHFIDNTFTKWMFDYGELIAITTGVIALLVFCLSFVLPKWRKWRHSMLVMVLTLCLGAGLITNTLFKGYWGRPRPKQVIEFGGTKEFRPFWSPNFHCQQDHQKSFPSGHAAMGYYYLAPLLEGQREKNQFLFRFGLFGTLFFGVGLSITRVAQGGHFFSDVLYAFIVIWFTILIIQKFFSYWRERWSWLS
ncbi:MAG: phosphatase PAP2 family protein [Chlamydiia bacterium]|nr:phosphatase PAP2 family protein [Chlamydiia bacterium]